MGHLRALSGLVLSFAAAPAFAQQTLPPLLSFLSPGDGDVQARLEAYDSLITGPCRDRAWGEPESLDGSQVIAPMIAQGALPPNTTRSLSTVTATGCGRDRRTHRYEVLAMAGGVVNLNYLGFEGETRVPAMNLFDFREQIAMSAGALAQRQGGCSAEQSFTVLAVTGTSYEGDVPVNTYLEARGPTGPAIPPVKAWREVWTVEYCPGARAEVPVMLGDHQAGGIGLVMSVDLEG
jgi:hypothetical protein